MDLTSKHIAEYQTQIALPQKAWHECGANL